MRNCPICQSDVKTQIKKIDFEIYDGHPMKGGYNLVQCDTCGFVYADTPVTQKVLDNYYTNLSKYEDKQIGTGGGFTKQDKDRLIVTADFLAKNSKDKNKRILDLGCANGGLLKELRLLGYSNLVGIDPSFECIAITKSEVNCECFQYSIFDIEAKVGKFDVIILSHVIEHILDLQGAMYKINQLLNEDGFLYIECPNASHYKDVIHAPFQEFNTEHINHFTEIAFENLCGLYNYEKIFTSDKILKIASNQDYHAVYGIFKKKEDLKYKIQFDDAIRVDIDEYITKSNSIFIQMENRINELDATIKIALYGVGQSCFKLLQVLALKNGRKLELFDNNSLNIGKKISGVTIMAGKEIVAEYQKNEFVLIISSLIHENAIRQKILTDFEKKSVTPPIIIGFSDLLQEKAILLN